MKFDTTIFVRQLRMPQDCTSQTAPQSFPLLPWAVSVAVAPVSALSRNSATSPSDGAVSAEYSAVISSALNTLFQILSRERPPSKKLLKFFLDHLQQQILTVFRPVLADSLFELITLGTSLHAYRLVRVTVDYEADDLPASTPVTGYNSPSDGPGNGPARRIANALGTSSVVIRSFPTSIACSAIAYGTGSGNDGRSRLPGARGRRCTDGQLHRDLEGAHYS